MTEKHKPKPRPKKKQLVVMPTEELERAIEELIQRQPGCPISGDGGCFSCRDNEIRADKARELVRRYRGLISG